MYHKLASLHIYTVLRTSVLIRELVALRRPLKVVGNLQLCRFYRVYTAIQDIKSPDISHPLILERCMSCHFWKQLYIGYHIMWASVALRKLMLPRTPLSKIPITFRFKFEVLYRLPSVDFGQTAKRMGWYQRQQATGGETSGAPMEVLMLFRPSPEGWGKSTASRPHPSDPRPPSGWPLQRTL